MSDLPWPEARVLVVDDQPSNVEILERLLRGAGLTHVVGTSDPRAALRLFLDHRPDLVLLDLHMPGHDGFHVLGDITPHVREDEFLPIVFITADDSHSVKKRALAVGAKDFVNKPFDRTEILLRLRNLLEARFLYLALQAQNELLEQKVRERTTELEDAQEEILYRLTLASEFRDDDTMQHMHRVGQVSAQIGAEMGLSAATVRLLRLAAPLHDLGKIAIPDHILLKFARLDQEEYATMRAHTTAGATLLAGSAHALLQMAEQIALTHHEHWDGSGYERALKGDEIPLVSRIVAVADVFDALTHSRPYKPAWSIANALEEIAGQSGKQFDPAVVDALVRIVARGEIDLTDQDWRPPERVDAERERSVP
ncbi:MAG: response regulator [Luteitalea sp.]|nr:response regulator [Luteitalea sp.]